ncbi:MAG: DMT family transporter [Bacteroidota bacterium]|nr:DMT family transporter [Bacteroidota bacterium]
MEPARSRGADWLVLILLALIWGSSFILMKRGLFHDGEPVLTPFQLASARLSIAWLALSPILFKHFRLIGKHWLPLMGAGVLGNGIPAFLFATAQTKIDSSLSGMLNSLTPLMTLIAGALLFGMRFRAVHVIGVVLGLGGAAALIMLKQEAGMPSWSAYALLPVIATAMYGINGNIIKNHLYSLPPTAISALALTFVGPICIGLAIFSGLPETVTTHPHGWSAFGHVVVLAVFGSAFALVLWNVLLKRTTALWASSVTYLMPIVAIGWGIFDHEYITWPQILMIGLVLGGVYLVSVAEKRGG